MSSIPANRALEEEGNASGSESDPLIIIPAKRSLPTGGSFVFQRIRGIPCIGILLGLLSGIFFATASFIVKLLPEVHPIQIVVCRSLIQLVAYSTTILFTEGSIRAALGEHKYLLLRGIFGFVGFSLAYISFRLIPLGDASTIIFSAPVYVSLFACVLLKEPCGLFHVGLIAITIVGVFLISKPTFIFGEGDLSLDSVWRLEGTLTSFTSSLCMALTFVMIRKLKNMPSAVVIFYFSFYCVVFGTIVLLVLYFFFESNSALRVPSGRDEYLLLLGNGLCGVCGQLFLTLALQIEEAGLVSLARTIDIVMAFIYQVAFLDELIVWTSILGAVIVCLGIVISALRKWFKEKN